jgi:hypothetical protein
MSLTDEDRQWIQQRFDNILRLVTDVKEGLEREVQGLGRDMHDGFADITVRLDKMATRLDHHSNQLLAGTRRIVGLTEWTERFDKALDVRDRQLMDLTERVRRLEQKQ